MQYILSCMPTPIVKIQKSRKRWSGGALVAPEGRTGGAGGVVQLHFIQKHSTTGLWILIVLKTNITISEAQQHKSCLPM